MFSGPHSNTPCAAAAAPRVRGQAGSAGTPGRPAAPGAAHYPLR